MSFNFASHRAHTFAELSKQFVVKVIESFIPFRTVNCEDDNEDFKIVRRTKIILEQFSLFIHWMLTRKENRREITWKQWWKWFTKVERMNDSYGRVINVTRRDWKPAENTSRWRSNVTDDCRKKIITTHSRRLSNVVSRDGNSHRKR